MNDYTELEGALSFGDQLKGGLGFNDTLSGTMDVGGLSVVYNTDYEALDNKPTIEGTVLVGNKTLGELRVKVASKHDIDTVFVS